MHVMGSTENSRRCQETAHWARAGVKIATSGSRRWQARLAQVSRKSGGCADFIGVSASPITIVTTDISYQTEDMKNIALRCESLLRFSDEVNGGEKL